jgi:hypothetical protein
MAAALKEAANESCASSVARGQKARKKLMRGSGMEFTVVTRACEEIRVTREEGERGRQPLSHDLGSDWV